MHVRDRGCDAAFEKVRFLAAWHALQSKPFTYLTECPGCHLRLGVEVPFRPADKIQYVEGGKFRITHVTRDAQRNVVVMDVFDVVRAVMQNADEIVMDGTLCDACCVNSWLVQ